MTSMWNLSITGMENMSKEEKAHNDENVHFKEKHFC